MQLHNQAHYHELKVVRMYQQADEKLLFIFPDTCSNFTFVQSQHCNIKQNKTLQLVIGIL